MSVRRAAVVLLSMDVVIIGLHLFTGGATAFNLDAEGNIPTWYSSLKLIVIAALAVFAWWTESRTRGSNGDRALRWPGMWLAVAGLFAALSLDETASLHERAARVLVGAGPAGNLRTVLLGGDSAKDAFAWPVLFSPIVVAALVFLAAFAWSRRARLRRVLWIGALGIACYVTAIVLEPVAVYFTPPLEMWDLALVQRYETLTLFEESAEVFGTTFLLLTVLAYVVSTRPDAGGS